MYIKNYWKEFYKGDPKDLFLELEEKLNKETYNEIVKIYNKYKNKV